MTDQEEESRDELNLMDSDDESTIYGIKKNSLILFLLVLFVLYLLDSKIKSTREKFKESSKYFSVL